MAAPSLDDLVSRTFTGGAPESRGLTAGAFRAQYAEHGEPVRWWQGIMDARGKITRVEQELPEAVRVLVYSTKTDYADIGQGVIIKAGATGISVLNDEIELCRDDRIVLTHPKRAQLHRGKFKRKAATGEVDPLPYWPVSEIVRVTNLAGDLLNIVADDFQVDDTGIKWRSEAVAVGEDYAIAWRALPSYLVLTQEERGSPIGTDGELLPLRWILERERKASYE